MPVKYKRDCDRCGKNYFGEGRMYCSRFCADKAYGEKIKGSNHPMWGKKHTQSSLKKMSNKTKGENNPMFGLKGKDHPAFGRVGYWAGKKKFYAPGEWHPMLGKKHTDEYRLNLSKTRRGVANPMFGVSGDKAPNWRGGITPINKAIRNSPKYIEWREIVFKRDGWKCQICPQIGGKLHADHIKPFAYYPELRFDINNGRTLCVSCHKKTETYGWKAYNYAKRLKLR